MEFNKSELKLDESEFGMKPISGIVGFKFIDKYQEQLRQKRKL
jgi:hypothetical protein